MKNNFKIKKFIKSYDIASPNWSKIPTGFPYCQTEGLDKQEKIVWEAATMAWINEHPVDFFGQKLANGTVMSLVMILISTVLLSFLYYADVNYHLGMKFLTDFFA